jgi:hypothetical protein
MQCTPRRQRQLSPLHHDLHTLPLSAPQRLTPPSLHAIPVSQFHCESVGEAVRFAAEAVFENSLATRASGPHSFPFRTRSLSPTAPMVLRPRGRGRVGRRRHLLMKPRITTRDPGLRRSCHHHAEPQHTSATHQRSITPADQHTGRPITPAVGPPPPDPPHPTRHGSPPRRTHQPPEPMPRSPAPHRQPPPPDGHTPATTA